MIELIRSTIFIIIPFLLVGLSIQEYFQNKYEKELYVERKFAYKLALSISTSLPMNLAILLTYGKVDLYSDPYFILAFLLCFMTSVATMFRFYSSIKWHGTYYIRHTKSKISGKKASIHLSSSTNFELVGSRNPIKSKIKKIYQDILLDALNNVDDDVSVIELKSPMLRKTSHHKINAILKNNDKVAKVENGGKSNLFIKIYMWVLITCLLRKKVKVRDVYSIKIHLAKPIIVDADAQTS